MAGQFPALVPPAARVIGYRKRRARHADVRGGQRRGYGVNQRRYLAVRVAPSVRGCDRYVVNLGIVDGIVRSVGRPRGDGCAVPAVDGGRVCDIGADRVCARDVVLASGAIDFVPIGVCRSCPRNRDGADGAGYRHGRKQRNPCRKRVG